MSVKRVLLTTILIMFCANEAVAVTHTKHHAQKHSRHHVLAAHTKLTRKTPRKRTTVSSELQVPSQIAGKEQLEYVLNRIIASTDTSGANVAVFIKSLKSGNALYNRNIYQPLMPASIMKILTAEAALLYLGADYRFSTQLLTDANGVKNGVLQGNLFIVLSGDPSLVYSDLEELMGNLQSQGINSIAGNVYIDNTAYDQHFYGPGWVVKDKTYCYGAPISASIINHNCPPLSVSVKRVAGSRKKIVTSTVNFYSAGIANGVVTDIPEYNRALFKGLLRKLDVTVYGSVTFGPARRSLSLVGVHNSEPLQQLIHSMLKKSDNVIAGALFKKLGQLYTNRPGSWENGSLAVSQILSKQAGVTTDGMRLMDGSGLSIDNLATPAQFMQVLQFAYHNAKTSDYFMAALPVAGVDGTLKHRMTNIPRKIRAKTGTISGVATLAGYATTSNKESLAFVIMINGNKGLNWRFKGLEDKIATAMTRYIDE